MRGYLLFWVVILVSELRVKKKNVITIYDRVALEGASILFQAYYLELCQQVKKL